MEEELDLEGNVEELPLKEERRADWAKSNELFIDETGNVHLQEQPFSFSMRGCVEG